MSVWTKWCCWLGVSRDRPASNKEMPRNSRCGSWWLMPVEPPGVCVSELLSNKPSDGTTDRCSEDID